MAKKNTIRNIKKIYSNDNMSYLLINLSKSILSIFIQKKYLQPPPASLLYLMYDVIYVLFKKYDSD